MGNVRRSTCRGILPSLPYTARGQGRSARWGRTKVRLIEHVAFSLEHVQFALLPTVLSTDRFLNRRETCFLTFYTWGFFVNLVPLCALRLRCAPAVRRCRSVMTDLDSLPVSLCKLTLNSEVVYQSLILRYSADPCRGVSGSLLNAKHAAYKNVKRVFAHDAEIRGTRGGAIRYRPYITGVPSTKAGPPKFRILPKKENYYPQDEPCTCAAERGSEQ